MEVETKTIIVFFWLLVVDFFSGAPVAAPFCRPFVCLSFVGGIARAEAPTNPVFENPSLEATSWEGKTIDQIDVKRDRLVEPSDRPDLFQEIGFRAGERYQTRRIRQAIEHLYATGKYRDIRVEVRPATGEGINIRFILVERQVLSSIKISGNYFVSEKELLNTAGLKPEEEFTESRLEKALSDLALFYQKRGYFQARLTKKIAPLPEERRKIALHIDIEEGTQAKIRRLEFTGQTIFPARTLKLRMLSSGPGEYYRSDEVEKGILRLLSFYQKEGYLKAAVAPPVVTFIEKTSEVEITVQITASNKIDLIFEGRGSFSKEDLRQRVLIQEERSDDPGTLDQSAQEIQEFYRREGYPFARVTVASRFFEEENRREVRFNIQSGPRTKIREIAFSGNQTFPSKRLRQIVLLEEEGWFTQSRYVRERMEEDAAALIQFYKREGFQHPRVTPDIQYAPDRANATVVYQIDEGIRVRVGQISFSGNESLPETRLSKALPFRPETGYYEGLVKEGTEALLSAYEQEGYLHASVQALTRFSGDGTTVDISYDITEGALVRVGKILLDGNLRTNDSVVLREMRLQTGDPYLSPLLLRSQRQLYRTGLFSSIRFEPIPIEAPEKEGEDHAQAATGGKPAVRDILLSVTERPRIGLQFGGGYADYEGLRGFVELSHRNLFGSGRSVILRAQGSRVEERYTLSYREPWFLSFRNTDGRIAIAYLDRQEPVFDIERLSGTVGIDRNFSDTLKGSLVYQYDRNRLSNVSPEAQLTDKDRGQITIGSINPSLIQDTRDDPFNPRSGSVNGITIRDAALMLGSEAQFVKTTVQSSWYRSPTPRFVFAFSFRTGMARRFGETDIIPISERFFLGGRSSVRGYDQDKLGIDGATIIDGVPTGGNAMLLLNEELRVALPHSFGLVFFFDHGNIWREYRDIRFSQIKSTTGVGARYDTPVGPVRLDWGYKLNRERDESPWSLHFTLGHAF
ncbi:MAG: outer membrane protein assembly factor BamA [Candidatus Manganitrophaceae bacterium]